MPERGEMEAFSNPMAPPEVVEESYEDDDHHQLTNADFRKMMMTPRAPGMGGEKSSSKSAPIRKTSQSGPEDDDDPAARRRKKKIYYAKLKRLEEERQKELAEKYRDRARERRDGSQADYDQTDLVSTTADYRAVAPDAKSIENYAERRKQVIQDSKYLGGDMEHTHLVKGLDYALLEKVRAEISSKEREEEQEMEIAVTQPKDIKKEEEPEEKMQFKTKMGRNIVNTLFKRKDHGRNELFLPKRMAYVIDLEDEFADSDVPTTVIRSKADCPSLEQTATLTTNDIVINKLTQILSYLRQGRRDSKKLKKLKEKGKLKEAEKLQAKLQGADDSIFDGIGDYVPTVQRGKDRKDRDRDARDSKRDRDRDYRSNNRERDRERDRRDRDRDRDRERDRDRFRSDDKAKRKSYFEKPAEEDDDRGRPVVAEVNEFVKNVTDRYRNYAEMEDEKKRNAASQEHKRMKKLTAQVDCYEECYPGMEAAADAIDDSEDEADYTKMDQGNKKGPVGRWDFDTQEEYSDYMANKEALPKAAFQYGVKMSDGRKTRRAGPKDEKAELDRQWQQIQNIMNKRKGGGGGGGDGDAERKKQKY